MWRIEEHRRIDKQLAGSAPDEILKRYEKWKDIALISGPLGLRAIKGFHDEALAGEWKGYRSSRLGLQWRVIYRVLPKQLLFQVVHVTPHDYRRP
jgi:addiction module RelE/StbE family toxin